MSDNFLHDSFEAIGQEGRIVKVTRMLAPDAELKPNVVQDIHKRFSEYIKEKKVRPAVVEAEQGLKPNSIKVLASLVRDGKNSETAQNIAIAINNWMELHSRRDNVLSNPACVQTSVVREALQVVEIVAETCGIGAMWGPAQIGKTHILKSIVGDNRLGSPIYFRATRACRAPSGTMRMIASTLSLSTSGAIDVVERRVHEYLQDTKRVLLFDEAERFKYESLETIRDLHDITGCGILFAGKPTIYETLGYRKLGQWDEKLDQLSSRIVIRRDLTERTRRAKNPEPLFSKDDIRALIKSAGIEIKVTKGGIDYLQGRACTLGMGGVKGVLVYFYLAIKLVTIKGWDKIDERILTSVENSTMGSEDAKQVAEMLANYGTDKVRRLTAMG